MRRSFDDDALQWETGELALVELEIRHPGEDVPGLVAMFGLLESVAEAPSDSDAGWATLRERLPERISDWKPAVRPVLGDLRGRLRRTMVAAAAAAAVLVGGTSIAYAAGVQPVRNELDRIVTTISNLLPGHDQEQGTDPGTPGGLTGGDQDGVAPTQPRPTHGHRDSSTPARKGEQGSAGSHRSHNGNRATEDGQGIAGRGSSQGDQGQNQDPAGGSGSGSSEGDQGGGSNGQGSSGDGDQGSQGGSGGDQGSQDEGGAGGQ